MLLKTVAWLVIANCFLLLSALNRNFIGIYDSHEGLLPTSRAISFMLAPALKSEAAFILVPGNLALRIVFNLDPPEEPELLQPSIEKYYRDLITTINQEKKVAQSQDALCRIAADIDAQCNAIFDTFQIAKPFEHDQAMSTRINLKIVARYRQIAQQLNAIRPACPTRPALIDKFQKEQEFFAKTFDSVNLNNWYIYLVTKDIETRGQIEKIVTPQHFMLFIPVNYAQLLGAVSADGTPNLALLGLNTNNLRQVTRKEISSQALGYKFPHDQIATSIQQIFDVHAAEIIWNLYIAGHGAPPAKSVTPIVQFLTPKEPHTTRSGSISGMPPHEFLKLLDYWTNKLSTNSIIYLTCYGGGVNARSIQQLFLLLAHVYHKFMRPRGLPAIHIPIIISTAANEESICTAEDTIDFGYLFNEIAQISHESPERQKAILGHIVPYEGDTPPLIILPPETTETSIKTAETTEATEATPTSTIKVTKVTPPRLETVSERPLVLSLDARENVVISGAQADSVTTGQNTIFFGEDLTYPITLQSPTINATLSWENEAPPSFNIAHDEGTVFIREIQLDAAELDDFLAHAFTEYGRKLSVSIQSLTGNNQKYGIEQLPREEQITIKNVQLIICPHHCKPDKGGGTFEYENRLYAFTLEEDSIEFFEVPAAMAEQYGAKDILEQLYSDCFQRNKLQEGTIDCKLYYPPLALSKIKKLFIQMPPQYLGNWLSYAKDYCGKLGLDLDKFFNMRQAMFKDPTSIVWTTGINTKDGAEQALIQLSFATDTQKRLPTISRIQPLIPICNFYKPNLVYVAQNMSDQASPTFIEALLNLMSPDEQKKLLTHPFSNRPSAEQLSTKLTLLTPYLNKINPNEIAQLLTQVINNIDPKLEHPLGWQKLLNNLIENRPDTIFCENSENGFVVQIFKRQPQTFQDAFIRNLVRAAGGVTAIITAWRDKSYRPCLHEFVYSPLIWKVINNESLVANVPADDLKALKQFVTRMSTSFF